MGGGEKVLYSMIDAINQENISSLEKKNLELYIYSAAQKPSSEILSRVKVQ